MNFWYVLAYLKCIQDVVVFVSAEFWYFKVKPFMSVSHIMEVYGVHLKEHAQKKSKLNMIQWLVNISTHW